jgi:hypothetical protein
MNWAYLYFMTPAEVQIERFDPLGGWQFYRVIRLRAPATSYTFELCTGLVRPGGRIANVGVHGHPATLHLEKLWIKDVTITTGLVDSNTRPDCCSCSSMAGATRPCSRRIALSSTKPSLLPFRRGSRRRE